VNSQTDSGMNRLMSGSSRLSMPHLPLRGYLTPTISEEGGEERRDTGKDGIDRHVRVESIGGDTWSGSISE